MDGANGEKYDKDCRDAECLESPITRKDYRLARKGWLEFCRNQKI